MIIYAQIHNSTLIKYFNPIKKHASKITLLFFFAVRGNRVKSRLGINFKILQTIKTDLEYYLIFSDNLLENSWQTTLTQKFNKGF